MACAPDYGVRFLGFQMRCAPVLHMRFFGFQMRDIIQTNTQVFTGYKDRDKKTEAQLRFFIEALYIPLT